MPFEFVHTQKQRKILSGRKKSVKFDLISLTILLFITHFVLHKQLVFHPTSTVRQLFVSRNSVVIHLCEWPVLGHRTKKIERDKRSLTPGGLKTYDLLVTKCALYSCSATALVPSYHLTPEEKYLNVAGVKPGPPRSTKPCLSGFLILT